MIHNLRQKPAPRIRPGDLILCETTAAIITHIRVIEETSMPSYSGLWPRPKSLCGTEIAWDVRSPVSDCRCFDCQIAWVFREAVRETGTCRECFTPRDLIHAPNGGLVIVPHSSPPPTRAVCRGSRQPAFSRPRWASASDATGRDGWIPQLHALFNRPVRWADNPIGDYAGRDRTLEVFNVDAGDQLPLLQKFGAIRRNVEQALGGPVVIIFHTVGETQRLYADMAGDSH